MEDAIMEDAQLYHHYICKSLSWILTVSPGVCCRGIHQPRLSHHQKNCLIGIFPMN